MTATVENVKRVLVGRPRATRELKHQLLPKWMALPVFSSDAMSSVAYATEEMMLVLALAGGLALFDAYVLPLSAAVAVLLTIVVISYRNTVKAYPRGGGSYIVSRENLGELPGLTAGSALLIDYTLTVAVSIAAGVAAITSALPELVEFRVPLALFFVGLVTLANLRGVKEAGALFAFPTYSFIAVMLLMIVVGLVRCVGGCPQAPLAHPGEAEASLTLLLLLRAFSSGATALTGVEAISDGVQAFRYPQSRNAAQTLGIMGVISVSMFLGISFLATHVNAAAFEEMPLTVTAQIASAVFGPGSVGFYLVQVLTAAILILAANTAYADFPRLSSILASDRFLPRQLMARGDRLVFSNGIVLLAVGSSLLLIAFEAQVSRLIQLYVVGVFTSFTLSQSGMFRRQLRLREPRWQLSAAATGLGAVTTAVVLVIVSITKFSHGAWIVIVAIPVLVVWMRQVHRHYTSVSLELRTGLAEPEEPRPNDVVVLLDRVDQPFARAVAYARALSPRSLRAVALAPVDSAVEADVHALDPDLSVSSLEVTRGRAAIRAVERELRSPDRDAVTTAVIPETASGSWFELLRRHQLALRLKANLTSEGIVVANVVSPDSGPAELLAEPVEHHVVVLVSSVHKATMRALAYAESLRGTSLRALSVNLESEGSSRMLQAWDDWNVDVALELVDSPFRSITDAVRDYVRGFRPDGSRVVVTCVLPEFVLPRWWQQPLHNQTALLIKGALVFEPGVVVTAVPYRILLSESPA